MDAHTQLRDNNLKIGGTDMRREFSQEFKQGAISLVVDQVYSRVEAARSLDIDSAMLSRWVREHVDDGGDAFRGKGKLRPEQEELRQLREENRRLKMEKEILKKAAVCVPQAHQ